MKFWPDAFIGSLFLAPFMLLVAMYPSVYTWGLFFVVGIGVNVWFFSAKRK